MKGYIVLIRFEGDSPAPPVEDQVADSPLVWAHVYEPRRRMIVAQFADRNQAEEREKAYSDTGLPLGDAPTPDIRGISLIEACGKEFGAAESGWFLTVVSLYASPGRGSVVSEDISATIGSMASLPGYKGHVHGFSVSFEEELWALVLWDREPPTPPTAEGISYACYSLLSG